MNSSLVDHMRWRMDKMAERNDELQVQLDRLTRIVLKMDSEMREAVDLMKASARQFPGVVQHDLALRINDV